MAGIAVSGSFDDLRSEHVRFLEEAARLGEVTVLLWPDEAVQQATGRPPKFSQAERQYFLQAVRYVGRVVNLAGAVPRDALPLLPGFSPHIWVVNEADDTPLKEAFCREHALKYRVLKNEQLVGFPMPAPADFTTTSGRKKVIVTGCYDWLHSGHVRFFEEVSELGDLYVAVGNDANVTLLKGAGHPLFHQDERLYMVQAMRYVKQALATSGMGWMDAEPEIALLKPHIYAVNEDGDKPEKRAFCASHGLEYVVLKRLPKAGLPRRQSTDLRGF